MDGFIEISRYAGMREDLVQAGGGNSSFKMAEDKMIIKASGFQLADMKKDTGWAAVNPEIIVSAFMQQRTNADAVTEADAGQILQDAFIEGLRPSIETFLHAVSGVYTLHTHPIVVNALAGREEGMEILQKIFPDSMTVPYATPGIELAKVYFQKYMEHKKRVRIAFLQNHGMLVSADTAEEVIGITEDIVKKLEQYLGVDLAGYHAATDLYHFLRQGIVWRVTDKNIMSARSSLGEIWDHAFCPDCVVFLGKKMYKADGLDIEDLEKFRKEYGNPSVIAYKGELYICAESVKKALEIQSVLSFSSQVMALNKGHVCSMLSDAEQDFLLGWDAEKYRRGMK